jgi:hypothetical protein
MKKNKSTTTFIQLLRIEKIKNKINIMKKKHKKEREKNLTLI